jgi:2-amino-4-hydroxy-6-hydroxymethyldihydropteridine diphosphokinase
VSLGSNLSRRENFQGAILALNTLGSVRVSTWFEAPPVGFDGPNFYNAVAEIVTHLSLCELQRALRQIEWNFGRLPSAKKNENRTLDLDLLLYGDCAQDCSPKLPRDDIFKFAFVLEPLNELCPEFVIPNDGRTVSKVWQDTQFDHKIWPINQTENSIIIKK